MAQAQDSPTAKMANGCRSHYPHVILCLEGLELKSIDINP